MTDNANQEQEPLILIAEDDPENIKLLCHILRDKLEYRVSVATDGRQALDLVDNVEPDLILLDVIMPEKNGFEVCRELNRSPRTRDIPVIFMSGKVNEIDVTEGFQAGAVDYVKKPFIQSELVARVRAHTQLKQSKDKLVEMNRKLDQSHRELSNELSEAAAYVTSMLPPPITGNPSCAWRFIPSGKLGGDIFGYHWIDGDHFAVYSLDVTGQGVGAALFSVSLLNKISQQSLPDTDFCDPAHVLTRLNQEQEKAEKLNRSVAVWYGIYSPSIHKLIFAAAGHPPALLLSGPDQHQAKAEKIKNHEPAVGTNGNHNYKNREIPLEPWARLFIFSDGACKLCGNCKDPNQGVDTCPVMKEIAKQPRINLDQVMQLVDTNDAWDDVAVLDIQFNAM